MRTPCNLYWKYFDFSITYVGVCFYAALIWVVNYHLHILLKFKYFARNSSCHTFSFTAVEFLWRILIFYRTNSFVNQMWQEIFPKSFANFSSSFSFLSSHTRSIRSDIKMSKILWRDKNSLFHKKIKQFLIKKYLSLFQSQIEWEKKSI